MSNDKSLDWDYINNLCKIVVDKINNQNERVSNIIAVSRGGLIPATIISHMLDVERLYCLGLKSYKGKSKIGGPVIYQEIDKSMLWTMRSNTGCILIIDDICDTGDTFKYIRESVIDRLDNTRFVSLILKPKCPFTPRYFGQKSHKWIVYPWELNNGT